MSNVDIMVLKSHEHQKRYILAKHTLFQNKFVGSVLRGLGGIPVNRKEVGISSIRTVLDLLKKGKQVIIFPEGTRSTSIDAVNALKSGMAMFALKSNSPIIPMMLLYKPRVFRFNKIIVGEPIDLSQYRERKISKEVYSEIADAVLVVMQDLRNNYIDSLNPRKRARVLTKLEKIEKREQKRLEKKSIKQNKQEIERTN